MLFYFKHGVWVRCGALRAFGTVVALQTTRVGILYGGHGALSTISGLLSAGVGVRRGVAGSLSNWVMCGGAGSWASTTMVLSASTGSTIFSKDRVFTPLDTAITLSNSNG